MERREDRRGVAADACGTQCSRDFVLCSFLSCDGYVANSVFNLCAAAVPVNVQVAPHTQKLTPELLLSACERLRPQIINTVPWILEGISNLVASRSPGTGSLVRRPELISYGGAALPSVCSGILISSGAKIIGTYGQTELGGPVLFGTIDGDCDALRPWVQHELEQAATDAVDEGELLLIDNLSTTAGYLHGPAVTRTHTNSGKYHTGDKFRRLPDSHGRLVYVCRKDDLIKHVTGEFTNPLVTEHTIMNASIGIVHAACMVGSSQLRRGCYLKHAMALVRQIQMVSIGSFRLLSLQIQSSRHIQMSILEM